MKNFLIIVFSLFATMGFGQNSKTPAGALGTTEEIQFNMEGPEDDPFKIPESVKQYQNEKKVAESRVKYCRMYNKMHISYYDDIYYVEACKRRRVDAADAQYKLTSRRTKIQIVDSDVIAVIPEGDAMSHVKKKNLRSCKALNGKYVTFSDVDVYYVEKCKLKIFPDWDSYIKHRNQGGLTGEILGLEWEEFSSFLEYDKEGRLIEYDVKGKVREYDAQGLFKDQDDEKFKPFRRMNSVVGEEYAKAKEVGPEVDIIPVDEACRGLNGRWVSFYSRMYKVEACRKRELDPELFWKKNKGKGAQLKVLELTDEQWISLPEGKPWDVK